MWCKAALAVLQCCSRKYTTTAPSEGKMPYNTKLWYYDSHVLDKNEEAIFYVQHLARF